MIESEEIEFNPALDYKISSLDFKDVSSLDGNGWREYPDNFSSIISAISQCSLKDSLKSISVWNCEISIEQAARTLEEFG
mmetsp:Transcript_3168/g.2641  ORF Transcript_3168/g.2641 Transcript_3168/m.2641 type:complete len:80 (-) Transcript_3168:68-307(-)